MALTKLLNNSGRRRGHARRISSTTAISAAALLFATTPLASAHSFPYVPTQVLLTGPACADSLTPCDGSDLAYIFQQTDAGGVEFLSLNFSSDLGKNLDFESPTGSMLPFLDGKSDTTAFGATRTPNGTLLVYAGDCEAGTGNVWSYTSRDNEWVKRGLGDEGDGTRAPYFLGGTVAFSSTLSPEMDQPTIYSYGGMCNSPTDNTSSWQGDANYTKSMLSLSPKKEEPGTAYTLSLASTDGPRTPIAGFTLTGLTPSMTNKSGTVTQQASWVLLGGHSETAFINMSTAALWNLPAESWTYVSIQAPGDTLRSTDLAVKDETSNDNTVRRRAAAVNDVYSRSGHTATLSEDGLSIVVLGGWVGDVDTPAEPQLAILEMTEAYSGWQWSIPSKQPDVDLYGHGAAVLPGNVMMVYGGWEMSSSSSKKTKRQESTTPRFYNLTSMTWASSYKNPDADREPTDDGNAPKEGGQPNARRLGLGLGLSFGLAALLAVAIIGLYWYRKRKHQRQSRDQAVKALSQDASHFLPDHHEGMVERNDDPWGSDGWYGSGQDPYTAGDRSLGYESLRGNRGGAFAGPLPGLHIPRKPVTKQLRGGYVQTATHPAGFVSAPGQIHPIYEDEEEESLHHLPKEEILTPTSEAPSDPFRTPTQSNMPPPLFASGGRGSATPSPEGPRHDPEVQDWVSDVDAADAMLARMNSRGPQGRVSPTRPSSYRAVALRDDESRSGSNLSDSTRSMADSLKQTSRDRRATLAPLMLGGGVEHPKPGSSSSSSYNTARSSFGALQAEGPSLLLGRNYDEDEPPQPSSPSKSKPRRGWLGSLRRVFSNSSTPTSSHEDMSHVRRSFDQEPVGGDYEPGLVGMHGELLRRKQGRQGWEEGDGAVGAMSSGTERSPETDWDIERAVEQRLVQVMFTVPRERLRVVNGDADGSDRDDEIPVQPQTAVLVDPEKEGRRSIDAGGSLNEKLLERGNELRVKDDEKMDQKPDLLYDEEMDQKLSPAYDEKREKPDVLFDAQMEKPDLLFDEKSEKPDLLFDAQMEESEKTLLRDDEKDRLRIEQQERDQPQAPQPIHLPHIRPLFIHQPPSPSRSPPAESNMASRHARNLSSDTADSLSFMQHLELASTSDSAGRRHSGVVLEAQAVPLTRERARTTRVLQMVDSFESLSREGSPTHDKK
ncbi:hypothetical protein B0J13DRAFT_113751 [Dactylonectria estremocensis]|uniref:Galactose oxidase n=1 Tax=Dactylonectria estremocensis TaxID=1079267 RepID=A0A9P9JI48_9HYPO|nr:hypothetical protein B0J13DRAFT_113751 [Dactylonectria estremocensis]